MVTEPTDLTSWLVLAGLLLAIFGGMAYVIKRVFIDKKMFGESRMVSMAALHSFQNADRQKSIEHVIYMEQDEKELDFVEDDKEQPPPEV
jgi:hypothetical protein